MVVFEFGDDLFHYGLAEKRSSGLDLEHVAIPFNCSYFPVIQIYDLPVPANQRIMLLLQVLGIDCCCLVLFPGQFCNFSAKLTNY